MPEELDLPITQDIPDVPTGTIVGRYIIGVVDGADTDDEPDLIAAKGRFEFTPSVKYVPVPSATHPYTLLKDTIIGILDDEGYLCTPDPTDINRAGKRGLKLFATDVEDASVHNWVWEVTPKFEGTTGRSSINLIPSFPISVPTGGVVDLTTAEHVPDSPAIGVPQALSLVASAESAASEAKTQAQIAQASSNAATVIAQEAKDLATSVDTRLDSIGDQGTKVVMYNSFADAPALPPGTIVLSKTGA